VQAGLWRFWGGCRRWGGVAVGGMLRASRRSPRLGARRGVGAQATQGDWRRRGSTPPTPIRLVALSPAWLAAPASSAACASSAGRRGRRTSSAPAPPRLLSRAGAVDRRAPRGSPAAPGSRESHPRGDGVDDGRSAQACVADTEAPPRAPKERAVPSGHASDPAPFAPKAGEPGSG